MARTKATLGVGVRLSDHLSASLLARVYPSTVVNAVLDAHGVNSKRVRSFPADVGVYYCMALSLYPEAALEQVFEAIAQGLAWAHSSPVSAHVAKSSISALRGKIGFEPLRALMQQSCKPLARLESHPLAFYAGLRLVAMDGSNFEIPDEQANIAEFGYPGSRTGQAGYPQAQCAVLVECATHAVIDANLGAYRDSEWQVCEPLLKSLTPGMLCMADRGFNGYEYYKRARASGAQLLWRCADNRLLPVVTALSDGSYLSAIKPSKKGASVPDKGDEDDSGQGIVVRVIEYSLPQSEQRYRLLTSLLDPQAAPALELAALYHERWHVEAVFDELKTHLVKSRRTLRSKTPDLVRQEFYGWVLAHYATRWLMHEAASEHHLAHAHLSFTATLAVIKLVQPHSGAFPPTESQKAQTLVA